MKPSKHELDRLRRARTELENHYIDELLACGGSSKPAKTSSEPAAKRGGTLRLACQAPAGAINPLTVADAGGLCMLQQTGEFLILDNNVKLMLQPMLATSWKPNGDASVWTFTLRSGVTFSDGSPMSADDVV